MQIKTTVRYHLIPVRIAIIKTLQITNSGEIWRKGKPHILLGGNVIWYSYCGKLYGGSSEN